MAEYSNLSATINAQIRANGVQAITGPVLNAVLTAMVNVLGDGYRLKGVAHPADNPGSPDNRVAYLAAQDGTYTNFGGLTISGEVALLLWDSAWTKETLFSIDTAVTPGSGNLVTSGAVDDALTTLANNIAAAYMQLVPGATEGNLAEFDNAGQVRDAGVATTDLAKKDGHYPDLFAGFAGNLVDTRSAGTRQGPFAFRQSGGDGVNYMRKILGRTEAWNQLVNYVSSYFYLAGATGTILEFTAISSGGGVYGNSSIALVAGHLVCLVAVIEKSVASADVRMSYGGGVAISSATTSRQVLTLIGTATSSLSTFYLRDYSASDWGAVKVHSLMLVDLTLEGLGLTTADQFRALHPLPYYNYNAGVLKNNAATALETVGRNLFDGESALGYWGTNGWVPNNTVVSAKNLIRVLPSTTYYAKKDSQGDILFYDANMGYLGVIQNVKNATFTTPSGCAYIGVNWCYDNGIDCINLSDPSRNGIYEPYWKRDIVLGMDNLACHDEQDNAVVVNGLDGVGTSHDEAVVENGYVTKIIKRFAEVDMGDLSWTYASGVFISTSLNAVLKFPPSVNNAANAICDKYGVAISYGAASGYDKVLFTTWVGAGTGVQLRVNDSAYTDAATFTTAMSGVKLRYPLATPKMLTLDNPIPALIEVDNLGTERRLPEDTADNPQAPFECDSNYSVSTANLVRLLNL